MKLRSNTQNHFAQVPVVNHRRSQFDRSHGYKTTFDEGYLIPFFVDEVLPGDTFNLKVTAFARLATPIKPLMDNMYFDTFFFFVPNRLVWDNFKKFMGEQVNPGDSIDYLVPTITLSYADQTAANAGVGTIFDYFGMPIQASTGTFTVNALPFRAYNLIWNEWFRDQNLQNSVTVTKADTDSSANYTLLRRNKRHDYFTSALPWPQKGNAISIPLGTQAPVRTSASDLISGLQSELRFNISDGTKPATSSLLGIAATTGQGKTASTAPGTLNYGVYPSNLYADLTLATAATINSLRQAFQLQVFLERDARSGTRYIEKIKAHFGVDSPDARLQRPEYLGGGSTYVNISPVVQTSSTDATTPQGNLSAIGTTVVGGHGFVKSFVEHGYIIGLCNVRADLNYQQGLNRMWSRSTVYDFFWPDFAHLGEQTILGKEIYMKSDGNNDSVFGYQERYAEYRYKPSLITGKMRSTITSPLDVWHLAQNFTSRPTLSSTFIQEAPPVSRVIAVPSEPHFLLDCHFNLICARPMPVYSVPGYIDHF